LLSGGTVRCWGLGANGQLGNGTFTSFVNTPVTVSGISTATALTAGDLHECALLSGGTVKCWGANGSGQLGNGTTTNSSVPVAVSGISGATSVSAGVMAQHTCVDLPTSTGATTKCWGLNSYGQLGNGNTSNSLTPGVGVSGFGLATVITAGAWHTCGLQAGGIVQCWGYNVDGQLGNSANSGTQTPVPVPVTVGNA
jgi:alpha-tubulin suppressor-like RCC1 family protein